MASLIDIQARERGMKAILEEVPLNPCQDALSVLWCVQRLPSPYFSDHLLKWKKFLLPTQHLRMIET